MFCLQGRKIVVASSTLRIPLLRWQRQLLHEKSSSSMNPMRTKAGIRSFATMGSMKDSNITVVFVRHGQSTWNQQNIFIGMTDTPLTEDGTEEARTAGKLLKQEGLKFDRIFTSLLRRSIKTVWMVVQELGIEWIPIVKDWRLNERHYGALVGRNKKKCVEEYGKDQVKRWRRSWDEPPPPMRPDSPYWPGNDERYDFFGAYETHNFVAFIHIRIKLFIHLPQTISLFSYSHFIYSHYLSLLCSHAFFLSFSFASHHCKITLAFLFSLNNSFQ